MAEKDVVSKTLESYPDVFADIINGFLFSGKQVVCPDDLIPADIASQYSAGLGAVLQGLVFSKLQAVFFVYNLLVGCFLTAPSFANPQKRNFQSMFLLLRKTQNKTVYHSMPVEYSRAEVMNFRERS